MNRLLILSLITLCIDSQTRKQYVATNGTYDTWNASKNECDQRGYVLATFDTEEDIQNIHAGCVETAAALCWLGFFDDNDDGEYQFIDDGEIVDDEASCCWTTSAEPSGAGDPVAPNEDCGAMLVSPVTRPYNQSLLDFFCNWTTAFPGICEFEADIVMSTTAIMAGADGDDDSDSDSLSLSESDSSEDAAKLNEEALLEEEEWVYDENESEDEYMNDMNMTIGFSEATWRNLWVIFAIWMVFNFVFCLYLMKRKQAVIELDDNDTLSTAQNSNPV